MSESIPSFQKNSSTIIDSGPLKKGDSTPSYGFSFGNLDKSLKEARRVGSLPPKSLRPFDGVKKARDELSKSKEYIIEEEMACLRHGHSHKKSKASDLL